MAPFQSNYTCTSLVTRFFRPANTFLIPAEIKAPPNAPTIFITKSVNSKNPTFKTNWRLSMQRDSPKPARVASPSRRPGRSRLADARNSERKKPKGTKTNTFKMISLRPGSPPRNIRKKPETMSTPCPWGIIPLNRTITAISKMTNPTNSVSHNAIVPYTETLFRINRITGTSKDKTHNAAQCSQGILVSTVKKCLR